jgi:hypothetical protein
MQELTVRSTSDWPDTATVLESKGRGRAYGISWLISKRLGPIEGWFAATLSRSERKVDSTLQRADVDEPVVLALAVKRQFHAYSFGTRIRYNTGANKTPVIARYYDANTGRYEPVFGPVASERLPDFFQLDLRVDRNVQLSENDALSVYLELLNVTQRKNAEELAYSSDYKQKGYLKGMPPMVVLGIQVVQ